MDQQQSKSKQKYQSNYVLKYPVNDLNSSFLSESNKSFMVNGEYINT